MNPLAILRLPRAAALWLIGLTVAATTSVSLTESYRALYVWATNHQVFGAYGYIWPILIDSFIIIGELALFVGMTDRWSVRARVFPWAVTLTGLAVSITGNVGHVHTTDIWTRLTAAVAPVVAWASLTVGLGVLKRVIRLHHTTALASQEGIAPEVTLSVPEQPVETSTELVGPVLPNGPEDVSEADTGPQPVVREPAAVRSPAGGGRHGGAPRSRSWSRDRRVKTLVTNARARGEEITGADIGRKLGVSERHGQRLLQSVNVL